MSEDRNHDDASIPTHSYPNSGMNFLTKSFLSMHYTILRIRADEVFVACISGVSNPETVTHRNMYWERV